MCKKIISALGISLISLLVFAVLVHSEEEKALLKEDFDNISSWEPLYFPKIKEHSSYAVESDDEGSYLKAESSASASGLVYREKFDVYKFPYAKWRWKVANVYAKGDAKNKKGDDYPIRIYIIFKYDPDKAGFRQKIKYKTAKVLYGEYPPDSALSYIWANKEYSERILTSKYTKKAKMILLQKGKTNIGKWQEQEVNILEDYKKAFGKNPPAVASIAIMNDSDNTRESSVSYVDYMEVYNK